MNRRIALATAALTGSALLAVPVAASAAPIRADVEREKDGRCSSSSTWDFNHEKEHGRIDIDVDVDSRAAGQKWKVKITHEGNTVYNKTRTTDREGEIDVSRNVKDTRGKDKVTFRATNNSTGEVCRASLTI